MAALGVKMIDAQVVIDSYQGDDRDLFVDSGVHYSKKGAKRFEKTIMDSKEL